MFADRKKPLRMKDFDKTSRELAEVSVTALITTDRFMIREFMERDRAEFVACHQDPQFSKFHLDDERGIAHASAVFDLFLAWQREEPRQNYQFAIALINEADAYAGNVGARMQGLPVGHAELGVELIPSCWRQGAATEIMESFLPWAIRVLNIHSFIAEIAVANEAAESLARKLGLRTVGYAEKRIWKST